MAKVNTLISKDYKTVSYPEGSTDEQTFGFFSSRKKVLDVDNNNTDKSTVQIMNRWNPNRKVIDYYLSDEFAKKENAQIKDLTYKTVDNLNKGLAEAGVAFHINLKEPSGKIPGDIRNSMIVLVEDPVASSVIGYGPQTEDPVTGEIVSARTVMFLGTIKKFVKYTYDEIVREKRTANKAGLKLKLSDEITTKVENLKKSGKVFGASALTDAVMKKISDSKSKTKSTEKTSAAKSLGIAFPSLKVEKIKSTLKNYTTLKNPEFSGKDFKSQLKYIQEAKNCSYRPVMEAASGGISQKLMDKFSSDAKPWDQLNESEKQAALDIILPEIWVPTLIHEMGHNLGLRHNFAASEDKANYYSEEDLAKIGSDHLIPFSSVMDYGNDLKTLPELGKYDISALKFGYLRKVEVQSGDNSSVIELKETLDKEKPALETQGLTLKDYQYCTDEHLGINAGCKQFDLGSSYTEIVQNMIKDYEDAYQKRNHRDGRADMSLMNDLTYGERINSIFKELRIMMEVVERIKVRFDLADDAEEWKTVEFLKDLKQASLLSGSFLTNVILVPDTLCAVALAADPTQVVAVAPLTSVDAEATSCFKLKLKPEFKVVAEGGKMLNSKKDPESTNSYADQIDVRGIWMDKVMAIRQLTNRQVGVPSMDEHSDTFLNQTELRQGILDAVQGLMTNNVVNKVNFRLEDGTQADLEINYDMSDSQVIKRPMLLDVIERQLRNSPQKEQVLATYAGRMGVNTRGTTPIQQTVAAQMAREAIDPNKVHTEDRAINATLSVVKMNATLPQKISKTAKTAVVDGIMYVADVANTLARESIEDMAVASVLEKVNMEKVEEILKAKLAKQPMPVDAKPEEKAVWKMKEDVLDSYVNGVLKSTQFYQQLLYILPMPAPVI